MRGENEISNGISLPQPRLRPINRFQGEQYLNDGSAQSSEHWKTVVLKIVGHINDLQERKGGRPKLRE